MGDHLHGPSEGNPKGYFEDSEVNSINEKLLARVVAKRRWRRIGRVLFRSGPSTYQRWLSVVPIDRQIVTSNAIDKRIRALTARRPFCFKDPRFSYTLPIWWPFLEKSVFVCIFRHPSATAESIMKECKANPSMQGFAISKEGALLVWAAMYSHILRIHRPRGGDWLFLHYRQLLEAHARGTLADRLGVNIDGSFADPVLERSCATHEVPEQTRVLYRELCALAGYAGE